ncbi:MAG: tetratricopeptide repeat protein [Bacteroidales bacterium]|uniref:hybrid sensor histidine kinase/response regulator transcription factor n=1 Tax=Porphyromonas sp. TaxID=1924944 RepID=UPI002973931F|nr:ATP-binding protein [Porphyromonas sp.]MDD7438073.1 tetratricopeptide repeat protein [Bacteroidales bacterium]MDY3067389.1 tetratricopeptide repeat protein [Porphyromonas sp.]
MSNNKPARYPHNPVLTRGRSQAEDRPFPCHYCSCPSRSEYEVFRWPVLVVLLGIFVVLSPSCRPKDTPITMSQRQAIEATIYAIKDIDSLELIQREMEASGDKLGSIVALRELGRQYRNDSKFDEALRAHSRSLILAEALHDTLEWIQALNNIGTNYRRMGILDVAQEYHYLAYKMCEASSDTSYVAFKNKAVSLNGLGNLYLTIGNYERADSAFRQSLQIEKDLDNKVGQAINYANLGAIFEHNGETDSAWVYYRKSMDFNQAANNTLGISLCHTYFGSLYEKSEEYDLALQSYNEAYDLMKESKDEWHALTSLIALARIHYILGNGSEADREIMEAKNMAERIKSNEHLADIYAFLYQYQKSNGNYPQALAYHEQALIYRDSLLNMEKINRIQNTSLNIERNRQNQIMNEVRQTIEKEINTRRLAYTILGAGFVFFIVVVLSLLYTIRLRRKNHIELKKLSKMRETFFTNITHEFRTPLTVILGLSQGIQNEEKDEQVIAKAQSIERQGNALLKLINQLLDISKIKSAIGNPDWRNGDITTHIMTIVESYRQYAKIRNITLQYIPKSQVNMDYIPDYLNKVINNLISNSFKFTPDYGRISILLWREQNTLYIDVLDSGVGMDEDLLTHIFEPFFQRTHDSSNIGTGVGLAMVKQIMDTLGGTITVESEVGKGTIFHLSASIRNQVKEKIGKEQMIQWSNIPYIHKQSDLPIDSVSTEDDRQLLLIVEDNYDIAKYIGDIFNQQYDLAFARNGEEGLVKAIDLVPDLILTDLMMPGMSGHELIKQVRMNEIISHIPIIAVTAMASEADRIKGLEVGVDAYITKPFNNDELKILVAKTLERYSYLHHKFASLTIGASQPQPADSTSDPKSKDCECPEKVMTLSEVDQRFLAKTTDIIYILLNQRQLDVNTLADKLHLSTRQFHRKITALTGESPSTFILKIKMTKAGQLLQNNPSMSIDEISEECGFELKTSFYHAFRKTFGVTPLEYRREKTKS